jgi:hypothetical protein
MPGLCRVIIPDLPYFLLDGLEKRFNIAVLFEEDPFTLAR